MKGVARQEPPSPSSLHPSPRAPGNHFEWRSQPVSSLATLNVTPYNNAMALTKVLRAKPRGFCAGVDRAIEVVEQALERFPGPVYVRKEIVHNPPPPEGLRRDGPISLLLLLADVATSTRRRASIWAPSRSQQTSPYLWK